MTADPTSPGNDGLVAIVTGASRGLGLAIATGLAARRASLVIDARHGDALERAREQLATDTRVVALPGDIADQEHRTALVDAARDLGGLDLLVHNAGILGASPLPPLSTYPLDSLAELLRLTVVAPLALTQQALPLLRAGRGSIITVTSDAAVEPYPGWGGYGAAKAAIEQLTAVLAVEEPTLRVWTVDPGDLRTAMQQAASPGEDISDRPLPETAVPAFLRLLDQRPPSGRYRAADLAPVPV